MNKNCSQEKFKEIEGPIVIGGVGGSGTRLIAQILKEFDYYIGSDLNPEFDNLSFTLIFKRPKWVYKNIENKKEIFRGLSILQKVMLSYKPKFTFKEYIFLLNATIQMFLQGHNRDGDGKGKWAFIRFMKIIYGSDINRNMYKCWGWKEPNSHLILNNLYEFFPDMKYIHVIRNGIDIAYSSNQQQLYNWGSLYKISLPICKCEIPKKSFKYWLSANKNAIQLGKKMDRGKFYLLNFDKFVIYDRDELFNFFDFLSIEKNDDNISKLKNIIKQPDTIGRYKKYNIDWLSENDFKELRVLDFFNE